MSNANIREVHKLLDSLFDNSELSHKQIDLIRGLMPELPKQKTLEEITEHVKDAWACSLGIRGDGTSDDPDISVVDWLAELHEQLKGLKDTPATVPALPTGMRIADHEVYGRVVTSPKPNRDGVYDLLVPRPKVETGADWEYAHECELAFIDAEPAKPAHPEFLETEADYENAPEGTVVSEDGSSTPRVRNSGWPVHMTLIRRRVLRWGWQGE